MKIRSLVFSKANYDCQKKFSTKIFKKEQRNKYFSLFFALKQPIYFYGFPRARTRLFLETCFRRISLFYMFLGILCFKISLEFFL